MDPGVASTILDQALNVQVTYGAVMLSFLGALHWGMEFAGLGGHKGYARLMLGAAPVLYGWPTLMLDPTAALIAQWVGFTGLWWADMKATSAGWSTYLRLVKCLCSADVDSSAPKWYSQYRFYLSVLVGTWYVMVREMITNAHSSFLSIIGSLAGTSYYGPVAGHGILTHDLDMIRGERQKKHVDREGTVSGPVEALPAGEDADNYVIIKKKEEEDKGQDDANEKDSKNDDKQK